MFEKIPMVWVAQGEDGKWKWCVGEQSGGEPQFLSVNSFKSKKYAKQNAKLILDRHNIPYIMCHKMFTEKGDG